MFTTRSASLVRVVRSLSLVAAAVGMTSWACAGAWQHATAEQGAQSAAQPSPAPPPAETQAEPSAPEPQAQTLTEALLQEIELLQAELAQSRVELARAQLDAESARRERDELRQFVLDHDRFGDDFKQYLAVKAAAEREARAREQQQARERRAAGKAERDAQRAAFQAARNARDADANRVAGYRRMGFTAVGLDVFTSKMAFYYNTKDVGGGTQIDYDSIVGNYLQPAPTFTEIDYSKMTISGSVLNGSDQVRNIGVAITFFDDNGNQVGHETVQINNARPDVPYPFTSKIDMALNRAFASSSTYVLYADAVE